jgi:hypothetical protein
MLRMSRTFYSICNHGSGGLFYFENLIVKDVTTPQIQLNTKTKAGVKTPSSIPAIPLFAL